MAWTFHDAWKAATGRAEPYDQKDVSSRNITAVDRFLASSLGLTGKESLKKIHAALAYVLPYFTTNSYPRAKVDDELEYVTSFAIECILEYCHEDGIPKSDYGPTVRALKARSLDGDIDWFLVWDAIGCSHKIKDQQCADFYMFAQKFWIYSDVRESSTAASK